MSFRAATGAALGAALLLTVSCGGGAKKPPRATLGSGVADEGQIYGCDPPFGSADEQAPETRADAPRLEDLPVTRLERGRVPRPNAESPSLGAADAKVVVQLWSDFQCPFCADVHPALTEMLRVYAGKVRLVWHDYPLPFHAQARLAANAGREAYAQGGSAAFWKFHDAIYTARSPRLDAQGLEQFARKVGLDPTRFRDALSTRRHDAEIERDLNVGSALGVNGTPAFLVNDYFFVGAVPFDILRVVVNQALSDAGA